MSNDYRLEKNAGNKLWIKNKLHDRKLFKIKSEINKVNFSEFFKIKNS